MVRNALMLFIFLLVPVEARETGARYLIITHDNFYDDILPLAEWKHKKGMRTRIAKLSETGATADLIRNYILNAYNTWNIPPEYVLLVGAPNFIPMPVVGGWPSDNFYTDMDNDMFNDILSGRLTVHDNNEAQTVVNKILLYERTPYLGGGPWFTKACLIANEDYGIYPPVGNDTVYWNDVRLAKNRMLAHGYQTIDTLSYGLGNDAADVIQAVNNGRGFVLYRGSGLNNWGYPFGVVPDQTSNGAMLPIVLSITCCTMGTGSTSAAAEKWLLTGTPTTPRGGAGYFATTTVGAGFITFLRSAVCRGFFNGLFLEQKQTFGQACEAGRRNVYTLYSSASEYRGFTTLGDPEMNIWTAVPYSVVVTHPQAISVAAANFSVNVVQTAGAIPVPGAVVCVCAKSDTSVYAIDSTDAGGNAYFSLNPHIVPDTLCVTVTGKNIKPYEGTMLTFASGAYVVHLKSSIDDSAGGNDDGMINPGEHINLPLWVMNHGDSAAYNVYGILASADTFVAVIDSLKSFATVAPHDSAFTGSNGYAFDVAPGVPDGHTITLGLSCRDIYDSTWISYFNKIVHAANLVFISSSISGGNGNSTFEAGETVSVAVTVRNEGSAAIDSVSARLRCSSTYIGIIDSTGAYAPMQPDSSATNSADPFVVCSDPSTPTGTTVGFQLVVNQGFYCDTLEFALCVGAMHYYIWNPDPSPQPGQNMHAILTSLGYVGEYGTALPANLGLYRSVFVCLGVWPNNHTIGAGGSEATALVNFIESGGRAYMEGADVWYYDPMGSGHNFCPLFGITATMDGGDDLGPVLGQSGAFTASMNFGYGGENTYIDHISPGATNAFLIFRDGNDYYDCGVAYSAPTYRTVGTPFELGLLTDGTLPSTRAALLDSIMHFFEISTSIAGETPAAVTAQPLLTVFPSPFRSVLEIRIAGMILAGEGRSKECAIRIYDVAGRQVKEYAVVSGDEIFFWRGQDAHGSELPSGIYFVHLAADDMTLSSKVVLVR